ncbi:hypothetical protein KP509_02G056000 [Ceratopteris richardii]|uniref:Uncharacterized protein n=1 Tax=Ceratopteris richardii TaxID=49495 RepID=A0A8T2V9Q2_CERRI|nr:hypothetical protein KP509_02G056000 [Ceratopteris richardii]
MQELSRDKGPLYKGLPKVNSILKYTSSAGGDSWSYDKGSETKGSIEGGSQRNSIEGSKDKGKKTIEHEAMEKVNRNNDKEKISREEVRRNKEPLEHPIDKAYEVSKEDLRRFHDKTTSNQEGGVTSRNNQERLLTTIQVLQNTYQQVSLYNLLAMSPGFRGEVVAAINRLDPGTI